MTCLEHIGLILKEQRQELKMSLAAMSEKTKLSIIQLEAIEEGNIEFFKDDLSYLSYFVRYYANALGLDFNEIRDDLDDSIMDFTNSISLSKIKQKEELNQRVIHKTQQHRKKARKNIDYSSVGLFVLTALILVLVGFAIFKVVLPSLQSMGNNEPPVVEVPGSEVESPETPETPSEPEVELPEVSTLSVTEVDPLNYEIRGWKVDEELTIDLDFANRAWVRFSEDGLAMDAPAQGTYEKGENAQVILKAQNDKVLSVNVGYFKGNVFSLNGQAIPVNADIAQSPSAHVINFKLVEGESTE